MGESISVTCPYCFEWIEIWIDADVEGSLVQDCEVCCHPWQLFVERDEDGAPLVTVERAQ